MTVFERQDVRYLDLDGDGLPDAVLTVETFSVDVPGDHAPRPIERIEILEFGIGIDGSPKRVSIAPSDE
jgi:hypothetical protein